MLHVFGDNPTQRRLPKFQVEVEESSLLSVLCVLLIYVQCFFPDDTCTPCTHILTSLSQPRTSSHTLISSVLYDINKALL